MAIMKSLNEPRIAHTYTHNKKLTKATAIECATRWFWVQQLNRVIEF